MKKIKFLFVLLLMITTCFTLTSCKYDRYIDDAIINDDFDYVKEYFTKYPKRIDEPMSSVFLSEFGYAYETPLIYGCLNFASIAFEEIMKDAIEELDLENPPVDLDKLENHLPVLKILIECDINPEYFIDEQFKNEYESALEIVELLKQLDNK